MNIGYIILCIVIGVVVGFIVAGFLSGTKLNEYDKEIHQLKVENNRKDTIINFYKSHNIGMNNESIPDKIKTNKNIKT